MRERATKEAEKDWEGRGRETWRETGGWRVAVVAVRGMHSLRVGGMRHARDTRQNTRTGTRGRQQWQRRTSGVLKDLAAELPATLRMMATPTPSRPSSAAKTTTLRRLREHLWRALGALASNTSLSMASMPSKETGSVAACGCDRGHTCGRW